jgi:hypothetical protein
LKKYNLEIGKSHKNQITINGESVVSKTYFDTTSKLYLKALETLDKDVQEQFDKHSKSKYKSFYWCLTYDIHRDDGIKDTVINYFLIYLVKHFLNMGEVRVVYYYSPDNIILHYLKDIDNVFIDIRAKLSSKIRRSVRNSLGPLKVLRKYSAVALSRTHQENIIFSKIGNKQLFLTNIDSSNTRWKGYPYSLNLKKNAGYFIDVNLSRWKSIETDQKFKIKLFSFRSFRKAFFQTFRVFKESKQFTSKNKSVFQAAIKQQSFLQYLTVLWRFQAWHELFENHNITDIHVMTTFGDPFKRLALSVAKIAGIEGHIFVCRPYLSEYRSEDRIIAADKDVNSMCQIPNDIIVLDDYSKKQLDRSGVSSKVYNPLNNQVKYTAEGGLLLLFTDHTFNTRLIELIEQLDYKHLKIYIRKHPLAGLEINLQNKLDTTGFEIIDLDSYDWSELHFKNVLTFSANSTSGLDAVKRGCDLLWLPFLSQNFLMFTGYASDTGKVVYSEDECIKLIDEYLSIKL